MNVDFASEIFEFGNVKNKKFNFYVLQSKTNHNLSSIIHHLSFFVI